MINILNKLSKLTMKTLVSYETIYLLKPDLTYAGVEVKCARN